MVVSIKKNEAKCTLILSTSTVGFTKCKSFSRAFCFAMLFLLLRCSPYFYGFNVKRMALVSQLYFLEQNGSFPNKPSYKHKHNTNKQSYKHKHNRNKQSYKHQHDTNKQPYKHKHNTNNAIKIRAINTQILKFYTIIPIYTYTHLH